MKAIVYTKYGPPEVFQLKEVEKPIVGEKEVLIKVCAASVNAVDWHLHRADPFLMRLIGGFLKPRHKIPGADVAGTIKAVGKKVKQFKPGDEVFGDLAGCGWGAFAEYAKASENILARKPVNLSFEEAAALPIASVTALQALRDIGKIKPGQKILINGASGGVGTFALQLAKFFGAEVTAICSSAKLDLARSLGADHVIDYTREDFTKSSERYDLIYAANGYYSLADYKRALRPGGIYVMSGGAVAQMFQAILLGPILSIVGSRKMYGLAARVNQKDLLFIKDLVENGKLKPVIDRYYTLTEVPQALQYVWEGHARGKVIIKIASE